MKPVSVIVQFIMSYDMTSLLGGFWCKNCCKVRTSHQMFMKFSENALNKYKRKLSFSGYNTGKKSCLSYTLGKRIKFKSFEAVERN